jgi:hypothetical protein
MRKNLLLLFAGFILAAGYINAQVMYSDDFDSYTAGQGIATQETTWWDTWSGEPGSAEDPLVSANYAYSGANSIQIAGTNDGVIEFDDLTTGRYRVEFYIYVPTGKVAYWNIMQNFNPSGAGLIWGMQIFMIDGEMSIDGAGEGAATVSFNHDEWIKVQHFIDLDSDWADLYVNDQLVHAYQWSKGTFNDGSGVNKLDAFDFYAWTDGGTPEYYMDNFLIEEVETPYPPTNFAYTLENGNDVVLTWDAPTEGTPESYSVARDGVVIGTTTELTLTDLNVYPNTYEYSLLAFYGTGMGYSAPQPLDVVIDGGNDRNLVIYEIFTSVNCGYCPIAVGAADEIIADGLDAAVIEYHISGYGPDPFNIAASDNRELYYEPMYDEENDGSIGYPGVIFNGEAAIEGALADVATMKEYYEYFYDEQISKPSLYTLNTSIDPISIEPYTFNLNIDLEETFNYFDSQMRLVVVLTETNIAHSWQGETELNFVTRAMYPNENGTILDFSSQTTFSTIIPVTIDPSWNVDKCELVVMIQKWDDGFIQQASKETLYSFSNADIVSSFSTMVFPNPANDILTIAADENINNIEVVSMTGQTVYKENVASTSIRLNVNNFAAGVYFVKVYTNNDVTIHKITIE